MCCVCVFIVCAFRGQRRTERQGLLLTCSHVLLAFMARQWAPRILLSLPSNSGVREIPIHVWPFISVLRI